jgi:hypothetical protein
MLECSSGNDEQNRFYNGWTCDHYIRAVLVLCPKGMMNDSKLCYNIPGMVYDSPLATVGNIYFDDEMTRE